MVDYSYHKSLREKKVSQITRSILKFHLTHQNTVLYILGFIFSYLLVREEVLSGFIQSLSNFGIISSFVLGFLFSYGPLTTPSSVALFLMAKNMNPLLLAFVAALGAMTSSFLIFRFIKNDVYDELRYVVDRELKMDSSKLEHRIYSSISKSKILKKFVIPAIGGILTASPLPTEVIVSILWTSVGYDDITILKYSFLFSFFGILGLALLANGGI